MTIGMKQSGGNRASCLVILALFLACSDFFGEGISQQLSTSTGGQIQILWRGHDDPGLMVVTRVKDSLGKSVGRELVVGWAYDANSLSRARFGLYETEDGSVVGLYSRDEPDVLLIVVDFENRDLFPVLSGDKNKSSEAEFRSIRALSQAAGVELKLSQGLVYY